MDEPIDEASPDSPLLDGLRVVQIGRSLAASLATMVLAEQGADVVVVLDRATAAADPVLDAMVSRGKAQAEVDFSAEADRAALRRLVACCDVVLDSVGDRALAALGLELREVRGHGNPGLISCAIGTFPVGDPRRRLPGYEAVAGMAGFLYDKPLGGPRYHQFPVGSIMSGLFAANAIVAALVARRRTRRGQHIDTSLYEANLFAQVLQILVKTGVPRGFLPLKMVGTPFMSPWLCRDRRYIYLHVTLPAHNARILELLESIGYGRDIARLRTIMSEATMRDPSQVKSIPEAKRIRRAYERIFITRDAHEWEEILGKELCCIKVRTVDEWLRDSVAAGMSDVCTVRDPQFGEMTSPGPVASSPSHRPNLSPRRRLEDGLGVLADAWERISSPHTVTDGSPAEDASIPGPPLQGIRVLDLSRVIAGPCAARVLAELGAEVVSVQNPSGLDWALSFHLVFNAGKKSVTLDFTTDDGKKKLWSILEQLRPHAFIQNYRHLDVARAVGVDPQALHERFPELVYTHLNAYGNEGGWQHRPGFEQVVQAVTGIQMTYAQGDRPKLLPTPIIDIGSGLSGAFATVLGLYYQARTGRGVFSASHLTSTAVLFQITKIAELQRERLLQHARRAGVDEPDDPRRRIVAGIVRALDNHVCVAGPRGDVDHWLASVGINAVPWDGRGAALEQVRKRHWHKPAAWWQRSVRSAGVGDTVAVVPWPKIKRLVDDIGQFDAEQTPAVRKREFPGCSAPLTFVRVPLHFSSTKLADVGPAPMRGGDTREVLGKIGERLPDGAGVVPYPPNKALLPWLASFARWGYFAWRSGNI